MALFHFVRTPAAGVFTQTATHVEPWQPPPRDTPIVMVTDLGIGGPVIAEDRTVNGRVAGVRAPRVGLSGCPLLALVPYEARRWPPSLARAMTLLHWSERTTGWGSASSDARGVRAALMATFRDRAEQRLRSLQVSRPYAVLLAETACLAVRVEAHLLRRLRLELCQTRRRSC